ncbi:MAG: CPBP family intramembrane metalloprotease [Thaumarchaeota archaeon]|nr:CPBP family intramembrane metalloprotease [Nitrososphaerota archaeon]
MQKQPTISYTLASLAIATVIWSGVFLTEILNFWYRLTTGTLVLLVLTYIGNKAALRFDLNLKHITIGIVSGFLLYGFLFLGFNIAKGFTIIVQGAENVYAFKTALPVSVIGLLLLMPISPAEEIFWRGLLQNGFVAKLGRFSGYIITTLAYSLVHLPTFNYPLMLVALIAGLVWGALLLKTKSLVPGVISHTIFNEMIFVIFPIN